MTAIQLRSEFVRYSQPWLQWRQIVRARAQGLRPADATEREYADPRDIYFSRSGGPRYVRVDQFGEGEVCECITSM